MVLDTPTNVMPAFWVGGRKRGAVNRAQVTFIIVVVAPITICSILITRNKRNAKKRSGFLLMDQPAARKYLRENVKNPTKRIEMIRDWQAHHISVEDLSQKTNKIDPAFADLSPETRRPTKNAHPVIWFLVGIILCIVIYSAIWGRNSSQQTTDANLDTTTTTTATPQDSQLCQFAKTRAAFAPTYDTSAAQDASAACQ